MDIDIIEVPIDYGADRHGSEMGPAAIRLAGLRHEIESLGHNIAASWTLSGVTSRDYAEAGDPRLKYLPSVLAACEKLALETGRALKAGQFPLILGGDHSLSLGSLAGLRAALDDMKPESSRIGVLYVDAHGDFNTTETSPSGNIHGMSLAACAGLGDKRLSQFYRPVRKIEGRDILYVGTRDLDPGEKVLMRQEGVKVFTMSDIDRLGFPEVLRRVRAFFECPEIPAIHISFDLDALDPSAAPGTGITVPGGLSYREALLLMEDMAHYLGSKLCSAEFVEMNPVLDVRSVTARMAVELIARLLGKSIY